MTAFAKYLVTAVLAGVTAGAGATETEAAGDAVSPLSAVRADWLPDAAGIVYWHWQKDRYGPALTGNESWRHFMRFLEAELAAAGLVDIRRNGWTFRRWETSQWPDDSRWSLEVAGKPVQVASYGANSGSTPAQGVAAPLALYEEGDAPERLAGRIAVLRTQSDPAAARALANTDYEFRSAFGRHPWPEDPHPEDSSGRAGEGVPKDVRPVSWRIFPQLMQTPRLIEAARAGGAVGALLVFDAGRELAAGLYTFPVPDLYEVPTLLLDREAGAAVIDAARAGKSATLRLEADVVESEAWQLVGFLPGRDYGTPGDEVIQLVTHTDGPAISQDNGALGILALVRYFGRIPQDERPRSLMVFLDCRHFMPGQEEKFARQDYFARNPDGREKVIAVVGMEHLGQIEYEEQGPRLVESGRVGTSMIWTTDNQALVDLAAQAVTDNGLPSAVVRNVARPGIHGRTQGRWYGMASPARAGGLPAVAVMGTMGGYWSTSSDIDRLDPELFRRQVAAFVQITAALMAEGVPP